MPTHWRFKACRTKPPEMMYANSVIHPDLNGASKAFLPISFYWFEFDSGSISPLMWILWQFGSVLNKHGFLYDKCFYFISTGNARKSVLWGNFLVERVVLLSMHGNQIPEIYRTTYIIEHIAWYFTVPRYFSALIDSFIEGFYFFHFSKYTQSICEKWQTIYSKISKISHRSQIM